ncbi:unnamed protein product [Choristocarpus tenellus]|uniref:ATPase subunit 8 n=1 Tax=Choristocarpus tenellus TaxID=116065 RepID=UPI002E77E0F8|nr:ATPase subunit 8 [Choristocarpus tenellus]WBP69821.1 ATPase subunit 8 [Choristocarpus tenellus]
MPQFDHISFFNQVFWLVILFCSFYFCTVWFSLPLLASSLKARRKKEVLESIMVLNYNKNLKYSRPLSNHNKVRVTKLSGFSLSASSGFYVFF